MWGQTGTRLDVFLFIAFFPQLVAGPIVRGKEFIPQVKAKAAPPPKEIGRAALLIIGGLFKKVIVANYIAEGLVNPVFQDPTAYGSGDLLLGSLRFCRTDILRFLGLQRHRHRYSSAFRLRFPRKLPQALSEPVPCRTFWRRWHISLSTWLRDYLYIPLWRQPGRRVLQTYRNLLITMFLGGLWHGASWTFIIWGLLHGAGLALERWRAERSRPQENQKAPPSRVIRVLKILATFHFILLTWIVFRASNFEQLSLYLSGIFTRMQLPTLLTPFLSLLLGLGFLMHWGPNLSQHWIPKITQGIKTRYVFLFSLAGLLFLGLLAPQGVADFIYFRF
jgi:alginate O-acetyltransferase complex protein AlgI